MASLIQHWWTSCLLGLVKVRKLADTADEKEIKQHSCSSKIPFWLGKRIPYVHKHKITCTFMYYYIWKVVFNTNALYKCPPWTGKMVHTVLCHYFLTVFMCILRNEIVLMLWDAKKGDECTHVLGATISLNLIFFGELG